MELGSGHHFYLSSGLSLFTELRKSQGSQTLLCKISLSSLLSTQSALMRFGGKLGAGGTFQRGDAPKFVKFKATEREWHGTAKYRIKIYKIFNGHGLYLEISLSGGKHWRQKYHINGREKRLSHGSYPEVSLLDARNKSQAARTQIKLGIDPSLVRLEARQTTILSYTDTFEKLAYEWLNKKESIWTVRYKQSVKFRLEKHTFFETGSYPPKRITPPIMFAKDRR